MVKVVVKKKKNHNIDNDDLSIHINLSDLF